MTTDQLRGSLLITIDDVYVDYYSVVVNGDDRKNHYSDSWDLYSTYL